MTVGTRPVRTWPGVLTRDEARRRAQAVSDLRYHVTLDLTDPRRAGCRTAVRFRAFGVGRTFLDYAGEVTRVACNGHALAADAFDGTRIAVPVEAGENEVRVAGTAAYGRAGVGLHRFQDPVDGESYLHTKFQPFDAHRVFPCFDQPDLKGRFVLEVVAPAAWRVVSNTPAVEVTAVAATARRWRFAPTLPLPPYLVTVAAGPFRWIAAERDGVAITLYARPALFDALARDASELLDLTGDGLAFFAERFGHPYPFGKYDLVFAPEYGFGAMEHPGAVTAHERFVFTSRATVDARRRRSEVLLHEAAHMWFGNLVTPRWWDDLWLAESFAVWAAATAQAETGWYPGAWARFLHDAAVTARRVDEFSGGQPVAVDVPDTSAARMAFNPVTYRKGAALLRQLAAELGDDRFRRGLRRYLDRHAWGNAGFGELVAACDDGADAGAGRWSAWLRRPGVSAVTGRAVSGGFEVAQLPGPWADGRILRLDVGVYAPEDGALTERARATVTVADARPAGGRVDAGPSAFVLPNPTGVAYAKVVLDEPARRAVCARLSGMDDPVARAVAWSALWDDVLDGRLPARAYAGAVLRHAGAEPDDGVVELLWERALLAGSTYGAADNRERLVGRLFHAAIEALGAAEPGSDRQLVWARMALAASPSEDVLPVDRILRGDSPWPGLDIDADLRWRLLLRLAVLGACPPARVEAALAADPSWDGHCRALAVRAASADPASKRDAWRLALDESRSLAERRAVMSGFPQPTQEHLLAPYAQPYFDLVPALWANGEREFAIAFTRALYPRLPGHAPVVFDRTDALLEDEGLPVEARRVLREERAALAAVVAARARDAAAGDDLG